MRHEQVRDYLSSYVEGALDPAMRGAVERHLEDCPECATEAEELRRVYALLASPVLDVEPPGSFHDNVMRRVRLAQRERARTPRGLFARLGWGWTAASVAAVAAVLLAVVLAVGPLHEGISAGFGLGRRPAPAAPATSLAMPAGEIRVAFPTVEVESGSDTTLSVRLRASEDGEWRLLARPSPGVTVFGPNSTPANGAEIWRGPLAAGQGADVTVRLISTDPGAVTEASLSLERADGRAGPQQAIFLPPAPVANERNIEMRYPRGTLGAAITEYVRTYRQPVAAPTALLTSPVPVATPDVEARRSMQDIAASADLRVQAAGDGYALTP